MDNYLLFQAYGNIDNINESKYFLLKYFELYKLLPPDNITIVIYTDQPHLFNEYTSFSKQIKIKEITTAQIKEWRGDIDFVHRVKIKIIQDFFATHTGNLLYCDTDTYIIKPLQDIFTGIQQGKFYMHAFEGILGERSNVIFTKWDKFLSQTLIEYGDKKLEYTKHIELWNAGVIGLNNETIPILDDVLSLTDVLYKKYPKHIAEQFSFDYCLQKSGKILSTIDAIFHYWDLKEFRSLLANFFKSNNGVDIPELIQQSKNINAAIIQEDKQNFKKLGWFEKMFNKLSGKKWSIEKYTLPK